MPATTTGRPSTSRGHVASRNGGASSRPERADWSDARYQAFVLLRLGFGVAPIAFGLDKFFNEMVNWPNYLAPWVNEIVPGTGQELMYVVGAVEILAGITVLLKPRYGAYLAAALLGAIIINLLSHSGSTTSPCVTSASCSAR